MNRPFPATARQQEVLRFITGFVEANQGVSPSHEELRLALGLASHGNTVRLLDQLEQRGWVRRRRCHARSIEVLSPLAIPRAPDGAPLYFVTPNRKENP